MLTRRRRRRRIEVLLEGLLRSHCPSDLLCLLVMVERRGGWSEPEVSLLEQVLIGLLVVNVLVVELVNTLLATSSQIIKMIDVLSNFRPSHCTELLGLTLFGIIFVFKLSSSSRCRVVTIICVFLLLRQKVSVRILIITSLTGLEVLRRV